jgi:hypothetical protein
MQFRQVQRSFASLRITTVSALKIKEAVTSAASLLMG